MKKVLYLLITLAIGAQLLANDPKRNVQRSRSTVIHNIKDFQKSLVSEPSSSRPTSMIFSQGSQTTEDQQNLQKSSSTSSLQASTSEKKDQTEEGINYQNVTIEEPTKLRITNNTPHNLRISIKEADRKSTRLNSSHRL